jgi:hypothetical protein
MVISYCCRRFVEGNSTFFRAMNAISFWRTRSESSAGESHGSAVRKLDPASHKRFDIPGVERQSAVARHFHPAQ